MAIYVVSLYGGATVQVKANRLTPVTNEVILADGAEIDFCEKIESIEKFEQENVA